MRIFPSFKKNNFFQKFIPQTWKGRAICILGTYPLIYLVKKAFSYYYAKPSAPSYSPSPQANPNPPLPLRSELKTLSFKVREINTGWSRVNSELRAFFQVQETDDVSANSGLKVFCCQ